MKRRLRTLAIVLGAVLIVIVAVLIVFVRGSVRQAGGRTCIGCVEWHWNGTSSIRAGRLSGEYRFTRDSDYLIRFGAGDVRLDERTLEAGCQIGTADDGARIHFGDARDVRFRAPAPDGGCGDDSR